MADDKVKTKPLFLITPGAMQPRDLRRVEKECGVVIVECKDTDAVRLLEPPIDADIDAQARAALSLVRMLVSHEGANHVTFGKGDLIRFFTHALLYAPQPKTVPTVKKV